MLRGNNKTVCISKGRDTNLELYRVIVMLLIVAHHYVVHSGLTYADGPIYTQPLSVQSIFLAVFGAWGKTGINCFVLITGYYMCTSNITAKKLVKLIGTYIFYKVTLQIVFWITGYDSFSFKSLWNCVWPISNVGNNFISAYFLFYLLIPFLNILVKNLTKKQHTLLLLFCAFVYILPATLPIFPLTMNYISWLAVLYFIGSYIRIYPVKLYENTKLWGLLMVVSIVMSAASVVACAWLGHKLNKNMLYYLVSDSNTLLAVLNGVTSFVFFRSLKVKNSKVINGIATTTFGVLCIHICIPSIKNWIWKDLLNAVGAYDEMWMPLHAIGSTALVFFACSAIDFLRISFVEKPLFRLWDVASKNSMRQRKNND